MVARIPVAGKPRQLALDADTLWVVAEPRLDRIDPSTQRVVASVPVGAPSADLGGVAVAEDAAWVPEERSDLLWRVDRATNRVTDGPGWARCSTGRSAWPHRATPSG